jgi:hypothetical protein
MDDGSVSWLPWRVISVLDWLSLAFDLGGRERVPAHPATAALDFRDELRADTDPLGCLALSQPGLAALLAGCKVTFNPPSAAISMRNPRSQSGTCLPSSSRPVASRRT